MRTTVHTHCPALHLNELVQQVISGLVSQSPIDLPAYLLHGHCVLGSSPRCWLFFLFVTSSESTRTRPWGPSPRFWPFSAVSDLLDVNLRCPVRVDSFCWRISVSSVIPPALSATGMSCLNALPVELVSIFPYTLTFNSIKSLRAFWK